MAEYIEREAAMDIFGEGPMWTGYFEPYPIEVHHAMVGVARLVKEEVGKIPAADVAPVVHGHPVYRNRPACYEHYEMTDQRENGEPLYRRHYYLLQDNPIAYCSRCGKRLCSRFEDYCPACGAKMDGKDEGDGQKD